MDPIVFFLLIQYVSCLFKNFNPNKSLPSILTNKLIGVSIKEKDMEINKKETKLLRRNKKII